MWLWYCSKFVNTRQSPNILYINYIALAIDPFLGPCYCLSTADRLPIACPIDCRSMWAGPIFISAEHMRIKGN